MTFDRDGSGARMSREIPRAQQDLGQNVSRCGWYRGCLNPGMLPAPGPDGVPLAIGDRDLFFRCQCCDASLVVDRAAAGMTLTCQECGEATAVPRGDAVALAAKMSATAPGEKEAELHRHLKENESQRTEITGYINQLNIQLHRWQLRLQTLNDRSAQLKAEFASLAPRAVAQPH